MKRSLVLCTILSAVMLLIRLLIPWPGSGIKQHVTGWDAFGYYMYLPAAVIYEDVTQLGWLDEIDRKYDMTGGNLYQADRKENGNYVFKYSGGIALMQLPFFMIAHGYALLSPAPADGFSQPYQWMAALSGVVYCILALFLLRSVLLRWFSDWVVSVTLILVVLATNYLQYVSINGTMSHSYIFFLYVCVIYATIKLHESPSFKWAVLVGYLIGLAAICRPTEGIMLFIPLFWGMQSKASSRAKWKMVRDNWPLVIAIGGFMLLGVLPQLIYWKISYGAFVYPMGSKWFFLSPFFKVLFGGQKGWFIYTPVVTMFIIGLFFMKRYPFKVPVIVFTISNIWIIIAWSDPNYGASYSARALMQGYPVMALAMASLVTVIFSKKWRVLFYIAAVYLTVVNIFQLWQYQRRIINPDGKNSFAYYSRVYLDPNPSPLDISLQETDDILWVPGRYNKTKLGACASRNHSWNENTSIRKLCDQKLTLNGQKNWLHVSAVVNGNSGFSCGELNCSLTDRDSTKLTKMPIANPISRKFRDNRYEFYIKIPELFEAPQLTIELDGCGEEAGEVKAFDLTYLWK